ncbi:M20 family peptidase [Aquabacterium lacunae]|uniref:M20 family peptidase n=1 Tax=Aquabacterium lacunae TaxID=2528630 RepID=A0A4Q9H254_9BURK|nr:M20 family peptidase [Aquabacterium lacunae]TBO31147.1 M20 family peptidase [Aquabacterium lacunae]
MSRAWLLSGAAAAVVVTVGLGLSMAWQTQQLRQKLPPVVQPRPGAVVDQAAAAARLSAVLRLQTVWTEDDQFGTEFQALHDTLAAQFPRVHTQLKRQVMGRHTLVYTWPGLDPQAAPIAFMAHQDVIPVAPQTESRWTHPPFAGVIEEGQVWGRGAWDNKGNLMAMLEAVEMLLASGHRPRETMYLIFGDDAEAEGQGGARQVAQWMKDEGIRLRFLLDQGSMITQGMVPGVGRPLAMVGMAEKGQMTLRLTAQARPGQASMPPTRSTIGVLGEAVNRLEQEPAPARLHGLPREMLETLVPHAQGLLPWVFGNLWLTEPLVLHSMASHPATRAMTRTTAVATMLQAGERSNALAAEASALVNVRLQPGDRVSDVEAHARRLLANLPVSIERLPNATEASTVSSTQTASFRALSRTLRELHPDVVVAPGLLVGYTDSRHFLEVADSIYRFSPLRATPADLDRLHGTNERIAVRNHVELIQFYERFMQHSSAARP